MEQLNCGVEAGKLWIEYHPKTDKVIYDICDVDGRILLTGSLCSKRLEIDLSAKLRSGEYRLWILDGDHLLRRIIQLS